MFSVKNTSPGVFFLPALQNLQKLQLLLGDFIKSAMQGGFKSTLMRGYYDTLRLVVFQEFIEAQPRPVETSKMESFATLVND